MNATCCPKHDTLEAYLLGTLDDAAIDARAARAPIRARRPTAKKAIRLRPSLVANPESST